VINCVEYSLISQACGSTALC